MIEQLHYTVPAKLLTDALTSLPANHRHSINKPSGSFFYDPWIISEEYKGTVWEEILRTLPGPIGEARVIQLAPGTCYHAHSDIDDRFHLNLSGEFSYLVDLDSATMHKLACDSHWYNMDAGRLHSAVNFGAITRVQLVVRKLLNKNMLVDPKHIRVYWEVIDPETARYLLDTKVSGWLNAANNHGVIVDFSHTASDVTFKLESSKLQEFLNLLPGHFKVEYL